MVHGNNRCNSIGLAARQNLTVMVDFRFTVSSLLRFDPSPFDGETVSIQAGCFLAGPKAITGR